MRVRWKIFLLLFGVGVIAYLQQRGITVASVQIMPQLGITQMHIGWLEEAFIVGYALMQFPGGILGQRLGARRTFVIIGLIAFAAAMALPLAPLVTSGVVLFAVLLLAQLLLGLAQGPIFPVSTGAFQVWFPQNRWAFVVGLQSVGLHVAEIVTPPLTAVLMLALGWQWALILLTLPALPLIVWWAWYGRNTPAEHPAVSVAELGELGANAGAQVDSGISWQRIAVMLRNRDMLALTVSYLCMNYVYYLIANWCFLYLVQQRHISVLGSGALAAVVPIGGAIGAGLGGYLADGLAVRHGVRTGMRVVPLIALPLSAALLLVAEGAPNPYLAVAALCVCFALIELTEGPYWGAVMHIAGADTMTATGILNTGGNAGGIIATPIIAWLSGQQAWTSCFLIGAACAAASALLWLPVDPARRLAPGLASPARA
jgi:ACS family glucarate transporter-like MFS transporter